MHSRIEELKYERDYLEKDEPTIDEMLAYFRYLNSKMKEKRLARINKEIEAYVPTLTEAIEQYKEENDD